MAKNDVPNLLQSVKFRATELFPSNRMTATICNGVITWWDFFGRKRPTPVMEHDYGELPDDKYIIECLEEHYER
jgi:hypothetical protein